MLKSILVGLDNSPYSAVAVELGIQWAKTFNALLVGLGIVNDRDFQELDLEWRGERPSPMQIGEQRLAEAREKVKQSLERFASRCVEPMSPTIYCRMSVYPTRKSCKNPRGMIWFCWAMKGIFA